MYFISDNNIEYNNNTEYNFTLLSSIYILLSGFILLAFILGKIEHKQLTNKSDKNKQLYNYSKYKGFYDDIDLDAFIDALYDI